jgi:hypothetical protein
MMVLNLVRTLSAGMLVLLCGPAAAQCPLPNAGTTFFPSGGGDAVDISGGTAVVGAPFATSTGTAFIHQRDHGGPGVWGRVADLTPSDGQPGDRFGGAVALHADRAVVGAIYGGSGGAVYVFERDAGGSDQWGEVARIDPTTGLQFGFPAGQEFGFSVAVWGDTLLVGEPEALSARGAAYIFERSQGGKWNPTIRFLAPVPGVADSFGFDVALYEDTAAVSEPQDGMGGFPGSVFIYARNLGGPGNWGKVRRLRASDKASGDWFGESIDLVGDTIIVGAPDHGHGGLDDSGAAYVFERNLGGPDNWGERMELLPSNVVAKSHFGVAVAHDENTALVSDKGSSQRTVYVLERHSGGSEVWKEAGGFLGPALPSSGFGHAVGIDATTALIGDPATDQAHVYELSPTQPFTSYCTAGTSSSGCRPILSACGFSSATAPAGFRLQAEGAEGERDGIFFFGTNGRKVSPWGNGTSYQCVMSPVSRADLQVGVGTPGQCDGTFQEDLNALWTALPFKNPGVGATVQAQLWYRDPFNTSNQTTGLSDAIEFCVAP